MVQTPKRIQSDDSDSHGDYNVELNSSSKKCNKPLMERRRRARINDSLNQLKSLVLQASGKDESNFSKLDKADILEMTVKHIAAIQQNGLIGSPPTTGPTGNFAGGFSACAKETLGLLSTLSDVTGSSVALQAGLFNHLTRTPCSPNSGTMSPEHRQRTNSPCYTPQRPSQQQRSSRLTNTPYGRPVRVPTASHRVGLAGESRAGFPASPLETNANMRLPALQTPENPTRHRYPQSSYSCPVVTNSHASKAHSANVNLNFTQSQITTGNPFSDEEFSETPIVKQEPDNMRDYHESVRDCSDAASDGSTSPTSADSSPSNSKAWRPW